MLSSGEKYKLKISLSFRFPRRFSKNFHNGLCSGGEPGVLGEAGYLNSVPEHHWQGAPDPQENRSGHIQVVQSLLSGSQAFPAG